MSAGTGISHSEFNASDTNLVHFLQIWIAPEQGEIKPGYEQKHFSRDEKQGKLRLVASPNGRENSLTIHQDAYLYITALDDGEGVQYSADKMRSLWIQVAKGSVEINGQILNAGDGAGITQEKDLAIKATADATEILLFDLA